MKYRKLGRRGPQVSALMSASGRDVYRRAGTTAAHARPAGPGYEIACQAHAHFSELTPTTGHNQSLSGYRWVRLTKRCGDLCARQRLV
jgi:hypothetical protein